MSIHNYSSLTPPAVGATPIPHIKHSHNRSSIATFFTFNKSTHKSHLTTTTRHSVLNNDHWISTYTPTHNQNQNEKLKQKHKPKQKWISPESWCDALIFPRPRLKMNHEDTVSPLSSPITGGEAAPSRVLLAHSKSMVDLNKKQKQKQKQKEKAVRPQDDLALLSPVPSLARVLADGEWLTTHRQQWKTQATQSLGNKRARALSRSRSKSLTKGRERELGNVSFLAARACVGDQDGVSLSAEKTTMTTMTMDTKGSHSHSSSFAKSHSSRHERSESWNNVALKRVAGIGATDTPKPEQIKNDSPTPSLPSYQIGIALSTPPEEEDGNTQIRGHPYAQGGRYTLRHGGAHRILDSGKNRRRRDTINTINRNSMPIYDTTGVGKALVNAVDSGAGAASGTNEHPHPFIIIDDNDNADADTRPYPSSARSTNHTAASSPLEPYSLYSGVPPSLPSLPPPPPPTALKLTFPLQVTPSTVSVSTSTSSTTSPRGPPRPIGNPDDLEGFDDLFYRPTVPQTYSSLSTDSLSMEEGDDVVEDVDEDDDLEFLFEEVMAEEEGAFRPSEVLPEDVDVASLSDQLFTDHVPSSYHPYAQPQALTLPLRSPLSPTGLHPPPLTATTATRSSYTTNYSDTSRMSDLSDFPVPPLDARATTASTNRHVSLLSAFFESALVEEEEEEDEGEEGEGGSGVLPVPVPVSVSGDDRRSTFDVSESEAREIVRVALGSSFKPTF